jgi:hypothetical protein
MSKSIISFLLSFIITAEHLFAQVFYAGDNPASCGEIIIYPSSA